MASRGHAGGLASTTTAAAAVLDAAGFDLVLIETVGTGQSEVEVAAAADTTVVLEAPEMGDEVQAIKAGLLEVADLVVVNKGDKPGALRTAAQLRAMLVPTVARTAHRSADAQAPRGPGHDGLDRRGRAGAPRRAGSAPGDRPRGRRAVGARRTRAEAQVRAILAERLRASLARRSGWRAPRPSSRMSPPIGSTRTRRPIGCSRAPGPDDLAAPRLFTPAFAALFAAALVFFTSGNVVLPVASRFAAGPLGADATGVGISIGAFAIAALALRPVVGWASDRFGRRPLLCSAAR